MPASVTPALGLQACATAAILQTSPEEVLSPLKTSGPAENKTLPESSGEATPTMFWTQKCKSFSVTTPSYLTRVCQNWTPPEAEAGACQAREEGPGLRASEPGPTGTDACGNRAAPQPTPHGGGRAAAPGAGGSRRARLPQQLSAAAAPGKGRPPVAGWSRAMARDAGSARTAHHSRSSERRDMAAAPRTRRDLPAAAPCPRVAAAHCHPPDWSTRPPSWDPARSSPRGCSPR